MRTAIVGGGPGGLYLSILLKKLDPTHEVTVYERNAPDDTFGFGVVFSDETLAAFEAADRETYDEITRRFSRETAERTACSSRSRSPMSAMRSATAIQPPSRRRKTPKKVIRSDRGTVAEA